MKTHKNQVLYEAVFEAPVELYHFVVQYVGEGSLWAWLVHDEFTKSAVINADPDELLEICTCGDFYLHQRKNSPCLNDGISNSIYTFL